MIRSNGTFSEDPVCLCRREVGIEHESGRGAHGRQRTVGFELRAEIGGAAVLPHDGALKGATSGAIPRHDGLSLVRNANGRDGLVEGLKRAAEITEHRVDGRPNLFGIVFYPTGLGEVLVEFLIRGRDWQSAVVKGNGPNASSSGIDGDHDAHEGVSSGQTAEMSIDFSLSPELEAIREKVRTFIAEVVTPTERRLEASGIAETDRRAYVAELIELRRQAQELGLWLPHMPVEWGGMGLGHVQLAMVQAEAARTRLGPWVLNCQAPDEGNMHTLLHWGTDEQKEKYLRPLCEGRVWSCFAMTEPEVAGSDPTLIRTHAEQDGEEWVINGHKWFISNAHRASFAILVARTEDDPDLPQAANTAFIVDIPSEGWTEVRQIETMHGATGHSEILIEDLRVADSQMLGGRGQGHRLGQYRLGPARLAHCMRWIAQAEVALDMMVARSLDRYSHGSILAEKQGIQWLIADSAMELYQCKLMVLHAAYKIDRGDDFTAEVSMAKHFVANSLNRIIDRAIQVHGALGYSTDTPLAHMYQQARWARFADGADEIHQMRIAQRTIAAWRDHGSTRTATGDLPI